MCSNDLLMSCMLALGKPGVLGKSLECPFTLWSKTTFGYSVSWLILGCVGCTRVALADMLHNCGNMTRNGMMVHMGPYTPSVQMNFR